MSEDWPSTAATSLDIALREALAFEPSPEATAAASVRIRTAIDRASESALRPREAGLGERLAGRLGRTSRAVRLVALLGAVLILGGASRGLLAMYEDMVGPAGGSRTAWERAAVLGVSETVHGYQVTLERAYADVNQLMLAISVKDLEKRGWTQVAAMGVEVTDERGRTFGGSMAMSAPDGASTAANLVFLTPPAGLTPGPNTLRVSIPAVSVRDNTTPPPDESPGTVRNADAWFPWHPVEGPWSFTITVDVAGGSNVKPDAAARVGDVEVRVVDVTISPSTVSARLRITSAENVLGDWSPIGTFEHARRSYRIERGLSNGDAEIVVSTGDGTSESTGPWILRIDALVGHGGDAQVRLQGPWVIEFAAP